MTPVIQNYIRPQQVRCSNELANSKLPFTTKVTCESEVRNSETSRVTVNSFDSLPLISAYELTKRGTSREFLRPRDSQETYAPRSLFPKPIPTR